MSKQHKRGNRKTILLIAALLSSPIWLPLIVYGVLYARFHLAEPTLTRNFSAEYNATFAGVPESELAWPRYLDAYESIGRTPERFIFDDDYPQEPGDALWPDVRAWLDSNREGIEMLHDAASREQLGMPVSDELDPRFHRINFEMRDSSHLYQEPPEPSANPGVTDMLLPHLQLLRQFARTMMLDARAAAEDSDADKFTQTVKTMFGIADHASEPDFDIITQRVRLAILNIAYSVITEQLAQDRSFLTDAHLAELSALLKAHTPTIDYRPQQAAFEDYLQRIYTDDGSGDGFLTPTGIGYIKELSGSRSNKRPPWVNWIGPMRVLALHSRAEIRGLYMDMTDSMIEAGERPLWEWEAARGAYYLEEHSDPGRELINMTIPALGRAFQTRERAIQERDGALTAIALERHRLAHGVYPESLDALVPAYLDSLPIDRFTEEPLLYRLNPDGSCVLYSRGNDQDDDGATPSDDPSEAASPRGSTDGDWILYPPTPED